MKKFYFLLSISCFFFLSGCGDELADQLHGSWTGISWTVDGIEKSNASTVNFMFKEGGTYQATYGGETESGTFRVFGRNLYTTEKGKIEKAVKFDFDEDLNLIFDMNRVGTPEQIVLKKGVE